MAILCKTLGTFEEVKVEKFKHEFVLFIFEAVLEKNLSLVPTTSVSTHLLRVKKYLVVQV